VRLVEAVAVVQLLPSEGMIKIVRDGDPKKHVQSLIPSVCSHYRVVLQFVVVFRLQDCCVLSFVLLLEAIEHCSVR